MKTNDLRTELTTKFFVHFFYFFFSYLSRGVVDRLEVVNKKWVRVRLSPGSTNDVMVGFFDVCNIRAALATTYQCLLHRVYYGSTSVASTRLKEI